MADNHKPEILDLDVIKPKKRLVKLSGKEIDVTVIPFDIMIEIADNYDKFQALALEKGEIKGEELKAVLELLYKITINICGNSRPEITEDWLKKNVDLVQMLSLMGLIIKPLFDKVGDPKNLLAVGFGQGKSE